MSAENEIYFCIYRAKLGDLHSKVCDGSTFFEQFKTHTHTHQHANMDSKQHTFQSLSNAQKLHNADLNKNITKSLVLCQTVMQPARFNVPQCERQRLTPGRDSTDDKCQKSSISNRTVTAPTEQHYFYTTIITLLCYIEKEPAENHLFGTPAYLSINQSDKYSAAVCSNE